MTAKGLYIHPTAEVQSDNIGEGTTVWQFAIILKDARIGRNCNINCHTFIENDVILGDNVTVKSGVYLWDGIRVAGNVFIGPNATFVNDPYPRSKQYPAKLIGVTIEEFASIGANATIMGGIRVGKGAMIGAGSVVTKDVPPYTLWYGNPARHKGNITLSGEVLGLDSPDGETLDRRVPIGEELSKDDD
jgi:acetyltransferase-like isoleucine patch superfamily enzyme